MRHSKAGQTNKKLLDDIERTLTKKGEEQIPLITEELSRKYKKDLPPELIITSTAIRAKQTAGIFRNHYKIKKNIEIKSFSELYINTDTEILNILKKTDNNINSVLVISHVPGLQHFAIDFAHSGDKSKFRQMRSNFPPSSFVVFDIDIKSWKNIEPKKGVLVDYINSKKIKKI